MEVYLQYCGQYANPDRTVLPLISTTNHLVKQSRFWRDLLKLHDHITNLTGENRVSEIQKILSRDKESSYKYRNVYSILYIDI
jgi:hypothetical protein